MTIPWLMNCGHSSEGWCLDCVSKMGEELATLKTSRPEIGELPEMFKWWRDRFDDIFDDASTLLQSAPTQIHGSILGIRAVAEQGRDGMDRLSSARPEAPRSEPPRYVGGFCQDREKCLAVKQERAALIEKILALPRYDCQGPEGDYSAGMEPGDGYVDYYELEKLLAPFVPSPPRRTDEDERK